MITDTGPLVAIVDDKETDHAACMTFWKTLRRPMVTTWPCLTEAAYLLRKAGGEPYVRDLWELYDKGVLRVHLSDAIELRRVRDLMETYRDIPCDLADASLVAAAETLGTNSIFTLDRHFYAYLKSDGSPFEVKP